jgi:hypothetical protein
MLRYQQVFWWLKQSVRAQQKTQGPVLPLVTCLCDNCTPKVSELELHLETGTRPGQRGVKVGKLKNLPQCASSWDWHFIYNMHVTQSCNCATREQNLHL